MNAVVDLSSRRATAAPTSPPAAATIAPGDRILRLREVEQRSGLSRATLYRRIAKSQFPAQVSLGGKSVGWRESEFNAWIAGLGVGGA